MDLVIVMAPKPPGSRQLISPPAAVFEIAPANVLHGAVRAHEFASSPTPETHVRVAWAAACETQTSPNATVATPATKILVLICSPFRELRSPIAAGWTYLVLDRLNPR